MYADTRPALERLKAVGLRIGIVSNHVWRLPEVVEGLGLGPYVDATFTSARIGYRKPHPAIFRAALEAMGVTAEAALFVGDSVSHDVEGPQRSRDARGADRPRGALRRPRGHPQPRRARAAVNVRLVSVAADALDDFLAAFDEYRHELERV